MEGGSRGGMGSVNSLALPTTPPPTPGAGRVHLGQGDAQLLSGRRLLCTEAVGGPGMSAWTPGLWGTNKEVRDVEGRREELGFMPALLHTFLQVGSQDFECAYVCVFKFGVCLRHSAVSLRVSGTFEKRLDEGG